MISDDEYPYIGWQGFVNFCNVCKIIDEKTCKTSDIDTAFIATNFEIEDMDDNPDRALQRFEFIEILYRIADVKYIQTK